MVGLRFNTDIAVRESVEEVMEALRRLSASPDATQSPRATPPSATTE